MVTTFCSVVSIVDKLAINFRNVQRKIAKQWELESVLNVAPPNIRHLVVCGKTFVVSSVAMLFVLIFAR